MKEFIVTIWFDVLDGDNFQDFVSQEKVARGNQWHTVRNMIDSFERGLEKGSSYAIDSIAVKNLNKHA